MALLTYSLLVLFELQVMMIKTIEGQYYHLQQIIFKPIRKKSLKAL